jgi:radical SAM protein with 4Fe4S-binding SPASM domain
MSLATFLIPIVDFILWLIRWVEPLILKLRVSKMGYDNPRVRHVVGKTGYWLHAYQLTYPNVYKWLKTRGDLFPMAIQVQTINRCNAACSFCPHPYTIHLQEKQIMDDALYSKIVDECVTEPNLYGFVPMSKNEPLLDTKMEQRVKEFKSKAQPHQAVELVTNGSPLTPARAQRLIEAGVDLITVSVNAAREETYKKVMAGLSWKQVMDNLEALSKMELSKVNIYLRFVSEQANRGDLQSFRKRWKQFNLFTFTVNNRSGTVREYERKVIHYDDFGQRLKRILGSRLYPVCPYVFSLVHVLENGDVPMCANDWANRDILGNVRTQTIREIYNSPRINEIRELMAQGRFEEIEACRECSFYHEWMKPLESDGKDPKCFSYRSNNMIAGKSER